MNSPRQCAARQRLLHGIGITVAVLLLTAGCGQKGPLYRPDDKSQQVNSPASGETTDKKKSLPFPAPQSQKKDRQPATPEPPPASDPTAQPDPAQPTPPPGT
ncbi:MAG TPA: lipoprotein [Povalibacter sp.]|nr:lipoprotein [Povalibacter sp.]